MSPRKGDMDSNFSHTLSGGRAGLPALLDALETHLHDVGVPNAVAGAVMIAADEVLANVLDHGGAADVEVVAEIVGGRVAVQVIDDGAAFNPLAAAAPNTRLSLDKRRIGGLGIHLVRELMDEVAYERREDRNRLLFARSYDPAAPSRAGRGSAS